MDTPAQVAAGLKDPVASGFSSGQVLIPLAAEYDPMFPKDDEKLVKHQRQGEKNIQRLEASELSR